MESFGEFILLLIRQFAGGPGPIENNLTRFGLASIFWLGLLAVAWSRQRNQYLPREKLLVWGFGLALIRELIMFGLTTRKILTPLSTGNEDIYFHPLEHGVEMASVIVVSGAFLRYVLVDNEHISRRYLQIGISTTFLAMLITFITWPRFAYNNPSIHFNETWESRFFHILSTILIVVAIFILTRKRDWIRSVVSLALGFLLISELLLLASYAMNNAWSYILCPVGNMFHILAIPIFGFVYLKELSIEKKTTEEKLKNHREHLEDLVDERTAMLVAQNAIADSLSQSLDLESILNIALDKVLSVLSMESGYIFLLDREQKDLFLEAYHGKLSQDDLALCAIEGCPYKDIAEEATKQKQVVVNRLTTESQVEHAHIKKENIRSLIGTPLISQNSIFGSLTLGSQKEIPLNQTNLDLLVAVCNQIGMAIENAYLYRESEIWAENLSTLHQASINLASTLDPEQITKEIAIQSAKLTDSEIACVLYWDKECETVEVLASVGLKADIEHIINKNLDVCELLNELSVTRKTIVADDFQQSTYIPQAWASDLGICSLLCTPIWGVNEATEFLFLMDSRKTKLWHAKDIKLVESFISRAAVALENANLHKQLEWAAALEERQRIAANIHDGVAQMINLVGLKVDQTAELIPSQLNGEMLAALEDIRETVDQASIEVRRSIDNLQNTPQPRRSLQEIVMSLAEKRSIEDTFILETALSFPEPLFLSPDHISQVTPIIHEAIINAQKHSDATLIQIHGEQRENLVNIRIEDNGRGFDVDETISQDGSHFGLRIMRARTARFGGKLQIISKLDYGTIITLSWMLNVETPKEKIYYDVPISQSSSF